MSHSNNFYLKPLSLAIATSFFAGCGGGDSSPDPENRVNLQMSGSVVDGYLVNATVCLDLDNDKSCNSETEPTAQTDENGRYELTLTEGQSNDSRLDNAKIIVFDGYDSDTNKPYEGKLSAEQDFTRAQITTETSGQITTEIKNLTVNVTAFTTLVSKVKDQGISLEDAEKKVKDVLQIPDSIDINADPVELVKTTNNEENANFAAKNIAIHRAIETFTTNALTTGGDREQAADETFAALAGSLIQKVNNGQSVVLVKELLENTTLSGENIDPEKVITAKQAAIVVAEITESQISGAIENANDIETAIQQEELVINNVLTAVETAVENNDDIQTAADTALEIPINLLTDFLASAGIPLTDDEKDLTNSINVSTKLTLDEAQKLIEDSGEDELLINAIIEKIQTLQEAESAMSRLLTTLEESIILTSTERNTVQTLDATSLQENYSLMNIRNLSGLPSSVVDKIDQVLQELDEQERLATNETLISKLAENDITATAKDLENADARNLPENYSLEDVVDLDGISTTLQTAVTARINDLNNVNIENDPAIAQKAQYLAASDLTELKDLVDNTHGWFSSVQDLQQPIDMFGETLGEITTDAHNTEIESIGYSLEIMVKLLELVDEKIDASYDIWNDLLEPARTSGDQHVIDILNKYIRSGEQITGSIKKEDNVYTVTNLNMPFSIEGESTIHTPTGILNVVATVPSFEATDTHTASLSNLTIALGDTELTSETGSAVLVFSEAFEARTSDEDVEKTLLSWDLSLPNTELTIANNPQGEGRLNVQLSAKGYTKRPIDFPTGYDSDGSNTDILEAITLVGSLDYAGQTVGLNLTGTLNNRADYDPFYGIDLSSVPDADSLVEITNGTDGSGQQQITLAYSDAAQAIDSARFDTYDTQGILLQLTSTSANTYNLQQKWDSTVYSESFFTSSEGVLDDSTGQLKSGSLFPTNRDYAGSEYTSSNGIYDHVRFYQNSVSSDYIILQDVNMLTQASGTLITCSDYPQQTYNDNTAQQEYSCNTSGIGTASYEVVNDTVTISWTDGSANITYESRTFDNMYDAYKARFPHGIWSRIDTPNLKINAHYALPALPNVNTTSPVTPDEIWLNVDTAEETVENFMEFILTGSITADIKDANGDRIPQVKISVAGDRSNFDGKAKLTLSYDGKEVSIFADPAIGENLDPSFSFVSNNGKGWEVTLNTNPDSDPLLVGDLVSGSITYGQVYTNDENQEAGIYVIYSDGTQADIFSMNSENPDNGSYVTGATTVSD